MNTSPSTLARAYVSQTPKDSSLLVGLTDRSINAIIAKQLLLLIYVTELTSHGAGIGQQFALTAIAMTTFRVLQAYQHIERRDDRPPVRKLGINLSMLHGCWVRMTPA